MSTRQIEAGPLPDDLLIAEFKLVLNIEDEQKASAKAAQLFAKARRAFYAQNMTLALLYDIKFEVTRSHSESWAFIGTVRLVLKRNWKALKKKAPKGFAAASLAVAAVAGYPDFRAGAKQIAEDAATVFHKVIKDESNASPGVVKNFDCRATNPVDRHPNGD